MNERSFGQNMATSREHGWIPDATVTKLRDLVGDYLDGDRNLDGVIEQLASELAAAARVAAQTPERMLIAVRELWREFTPSHHDRLQLAALYDRLVRKAIDSYFAT